jgi:hypothetical protein
LARPRQDKREMIGAWLRPIGWILAATLAGFLFYVLLFALGTAGGVQILFYRGVLLAMIAAVATVGALALLLRGRDPSLAIAAGVASFSFNICFLVLLPVTVDRSVTVFLLSTIDRQPGLTEAELERTFVDRYVVGMRAMDRRITEQSLSGNIEVGPDGGVRLTPQGERFMGFSRAISTIFRTDPRFVAGPDSASAKAR